MTSFNQNCDFQKADEARQRQAEWRAAWDNHQESFYLRVTAIFGGDRARAERWFASPSKELGGCPPKLMLQTYAGMDVLNDFIDALVDRVFA